MKFLHFHTFRVFTNFGCNILRHAIHTEGRKEGMTETARTASGPGLAAVVSHARTRAQEEKRPVRRSGIRLPPSLQSIDIASVSIDTHGKHIDFNGYCIDFNGYYINFNGCEWRITLI